MRWFVFGLSTLILIAVESSLSLQFSVWGVRPDLVLVLTMTVALMRGPVSGAVAGLIGGLLIDVAGGHLIGLSVLVKMSLGLAAGIIARRVFWDNAFIPVVFIFAAGLLDRTLYFSLAKLFGATYIQADVLVRMLLPSAWYGALVSVFLYPLFKYLIVYVERLFGVEEPGVGRSERRLAKPTMAFNHHVRR